MNIFESVRFLDEGQQAEEYKARKEKDRLDSHMSDIDRFNRRYANGNSYSQSAKEKVEKELSKRLDSVDRAYASGSGEDLRKAVSHKKNMDGKLMTSLDATNRHMRRHPEQFKESVESIIENLKMI